MSVSIVTFMITNYIAQFKYLPESVDIYAGIGQHQCQGRWIYGGYNNLGRNMTVQHTFNLPVHLKVRITATILLEDSWDHEILKFSVDGNVVQEFTKGVHDGFLMCGNSLYEDEWRNLYWEGDHTSNTLLVKFENNLNEPLDNESWGMIDFSVSILSECYSVYTECDFQGTEYQFCPTTPKENQQEILQPIKSIGVPLGKQLSIQAPDFKGGVLQTYTSDQNCIDPFTFPKNVFVPEP